MCEDTCHQVKRCVFMGVALLTGASVAVMTLWNWLIPCIFGLHCIGFWQAMGLLVLSRLLFGGRGGFGGGFGPGGMWRRRMFEKWEKMSPEDREKFREGMWGGKCGRGSHKGGGTGGATPSAEGPAQEV